MNNIGKFIFSGNFLQDDKIQKHLKEKKLLIEKEFGSKSKFIKHYDSITLESLIEDKKKYGDNYLSKNKITFLSLIINRKSYKKEKFNGKFYRIIKEPIEKLDSKEWYYSNPKTKFMRFNNENERMLYISECENVCFYETKIEDGESISMIEYKLLKDLNIVFYGKETDNNRYNSYKEYILSFYGRIMFRDDLYKYSKEEYYSVMNDIKKYFDEARIGEKPHQGYGKISFAKPCNNMECKSISIGIKSEYERKYLMPYKVTSFAMKVQGEKKTYKKLERKYVKELLK